MWVLRGPFLFQKTFNRDLQWQNIRDTYRAYRIPRLDSQIAINEKIAALAISNPFIPQSPIGRSNAKSAGVRQFITGLFFFPAIANRQIAASGK